MRTPSRASWSLYHCGPQWAKRLLLTGDSLSGKDAAEIGLAMKSYPADELEAEVPPGKKCPACGGMMAHSRLRGYYCVRECGR